MLDKSIIERKTVPINPLADKVWAWDMISAMACGSSASAHTRSCHEIHLASRNVQKTFETSASYVVHGFVFDFKIIAVTSSAASL